MSPVRVGLVGAGFMGKIHSIAYRNAAMLFGAEVPRIEPVVVTDFDPSLAARAVRDWGWSRAVDNWQEVTAADDVDVIDICTPNDAHVDVAIDAFVRGKHVLCEKPLALNADDAFRLCEAAAASGLVAQVGFVYRQWPAVTMARRLVDEGAIGAVRTVRAHFLLDYNSNPDVPMSWRFDRARAGSGALGDVGSHCIDLLQYLAGPIASVCASMQTFVPRRTTTTGEAVDVTVDDQTEVLVDLESGASGTILASWAAPGHK
ncbi:MAG TPA: Gfo/Idh/MocA family oxidoreductase, partial [Ilumatobacteraceae bacterium]|nr:Gfo/Idh/MocA family oxidoreductase [Ilumatobacteraceae bacterium]